MSNLKNKPGIYHDVNPSDYFRLGTVRDDGTLIERGSPEYVLSRSALREFSRCPKAWKIGRPAKVSKAFTWGTLIDILCLTPHISEEMLIVQPETYSSAPESGTFALTTDFPGGEWNGRKKDCREWKSEQEAKGLVVLTPEELEAKSAEKPWNANATYCREWLANTPRGREVISQEMSEQAKQALAMIEEDEIFSHVLANSKKQTVVVWDWICPMTERAIRCKAMLDIVPDGTSALIDLKTTADASPEAWGYHVKKYGYHYQGAMYLDGWNSAAEASEISDRRSIFAHLISESLAPYPTARRVLDDEFIEVGRMGYEADLLKYSACVHSGEWPGYSDGEDSGFETVACPSFIFRNAGITSEQANLEAIAILGKEVKS